MYDEGKLAEICAERVKALTNQEKEVFDTIIDYLDTLPEGFFETNTVEQLNRHFGGNGDMLVTENVRLALDAQQKLELLIESMGDVYDEHPEEDEDVDEDDEDKDEEIDTRIRKSLERNNYRRAQILLEQVIVDLNRQLDEKMEYYTYNEPMELVLYIHHFSLHPDEVSIPYSLAHYYYMLGNVYLELDEIDQAKAMLFRAIQLDPVSTDFLLAFAEAFKREDDFDSFLQLTRKAITFAYSREKYARCIRNIGYFLIENEHYDGAAVCFRYSQLWKKTEYAENALQYIEKITGHTADNAGPEMSTIAKHYRFSLGLDPDIRELVDDMRSKYEKDGNAEEAAYFSSILEAMTVE